MKTRTKLISMAAVLLIAGIISACGTSSSDNSETPSSETVSLTQSETVSAETPDENEDGQNPVMNFVGPYACERATMEVQAKDSSSALINVHWAGSASTDAEWEMSGDFNSETMTVSYTDCKKTIKEFDETGSTVSENTEYENGKGELIFHEDNTITWEDDEENIADGMVFTFSFNSEE